MDTYKSKAGILTIPAKRMRKIHDFKAVCACVSEATGATIVGVNVRKRVGCNDAFRCTNGEMLSN